MTHDVFQSFPDSMIGQYDIVHIQLFACIVKQNDPVPVMKNLISLLSKSAPVMYPPKRSFVGPRS